VKPDQKSENKADKREEDKQVRKWSNFIEERRVFLTDNKIVSLSIGWQ